MFNDGRRTLGCVGKRRAGRGGGSAAQVDVVLDRERYAVQWQVLELAALQRAQVGFQFGGAEQVDEQVIIRVQRCGFVAQGEDQLPWSLAAALIGGADAVQAQVVQKHVVSHGEIPSENKRFNQLQGPRPVARHAPPIRVAPALRVRCQPGLPAAGFPSSSTPE